MNNYRGEIGTIDLPFGKVVPLTVNFGRTVGHAVLRSDGGMKATVTDMEFWDSLMNHPNMALSLSLDNRWTMAVCHERDFDE